MPEITKTKNQRPKFENATRILFTFAVAAFYFFGLTIPLLGPDEPRYAQVAREMFERGDWVTPTLGGFDWFEKPALLYWLQIVSYKFFGVSEFAARFGSALFGLGTVLSLWILGRFSAAKDAKKPRQIEIGNSVSVNSVSSAAKKDFANWLALIAASSIGLIAFSRGASFDIILTFPITASLVGFFIFEQSNKKSLIDYYLPLIAFYLFIGAALIAKGLVGVVFPFAIVAFYYLLSWKIPSKTFIFSLFWGTILSLLIASIWYLPMYQANGWKFIDEFFFQQQFARYASNKYLHPQPFWFFWLILPLMTLPWLPFFVASIWDFIKVQSSKSKVQNSKSKVQSLDNSPFSPVSSPALLLFSFSWLLVPLVFFTFSGSKLPGYILPALPAALILTAEYVSRFAQKSKNRKTFVWLVAFATFAIVAVCLQFFVAPYSQSETVKPLIETANANGYINEKVLNLNTISHNAEFYAAGRLARTVDGKQRRFYSAAEIAAEMNVENARSDLVLVPIQYLEELTGSDLIEAEVLGDNTELAIVLVKIK